MSAHHHSDHGDHHGDDHGLGHVIGMPVLLGTWGALMALTVITVGTAMYLKLGQPWDLVVALIIATTKATLVCAFFMHLRYDKLLHTIVFASALLFFMLFVGITLMDRSQYEDDVRWNQTTDSHSRDQTF